MSRQRKHPVPPLCECGALPQCGDKRGLYYVCRSCKSSYHLIEGELVLVEKRPPRRKATVVVKEGLSADEYEELVG